MKTSRQLSTILMRNTKYSCFRNYSFNHNPNISEVIKFVEWGSNRVIRQQGFRILPISEDLKHIKQWERIIDPHFIINKSMYISQPKGQSIIVIHIGEISNG